MRLKLEKYHGLGNDYLVFDPEVQQAGADSATGEAAVQPQCGSRRRWHSGRTCFKEGKMPYDHLESGWKPDGKQWKRYPYFRKNT